jgi:hypothetical protein
MIMTTPHPLAPRAPAGLAVRAEQVQHIAKIAKLRGQPAVADALQLVSSNGQLGDPEFMISAKAQHGISEDQQRVIHD